MWAALGYLAGSIVGAATALIDLEDVPPRAATHGPDPIGSLLHVGVDGIRAFLVLAYIVFMGLIGAVIGAVYGLVQTAMRPKTASPSAIEAENAALKARIAELERECGMNGSS